MRNVGVSVLGTLLVGCASSNVVVKIPAPPPDASQQGSQRVSVTVNDLRAPGRAASTREAAFGVPMGNISFDPPETQIVKSALESALSSRSAVPASATYACDLLDFGVNTDTTTLYWDVIGVIRLTCRHGGQSQVLFGTHTERTYTWPGEAVIRRVVEESMKKVVAQLDAAPPAT